MVEFNLLEFLAMVVSIIIIIHIIDKIDRWSWLGYTKKGYCYAG